MCDISMMHALHYYNIRAIPYYYTRAREAVVIPLRRNAASSALIVCLYLR